APSVVPPRYIILRGSKGILFPESPPIAYSLHQITASEGGSSGRNRARFDHLTLWKVSNDRIALLAFSRRNHLHLRRVPADNLAARPSANESSPESFDHTSGLRSSRLSQ